MNIDKIKIGKWDTLVYTDKDEVCIALEGEGGAVVGADNFDDAKATFIEAMNLAESVSKLLYFKKFGKFPNLTQQQ